MAKPLRPAVLAVVVAIVVVAMLVGLLDDDDSAPPTGGPSPTQLARLADVEAWMRAGFASADWWPRITEIRVAPGWVAVDTDLPAEAWAAERAVAMCSAAWQAPHDGDGPLPVRVASADGVTLARNFSTARGVFAGCEAQL